MQLQESGEMYLETILILSKKSSEVHQVDICEEMGFSKPSVSRAMGLLKNAGYITIDENSHIFLTDLGRKTAEKIYERHTVLTRFFEQIGVESETAADDACKVEHVISDETFYALKRCLKK